MNNKSFNQLLLHILVAFVSLYVSLLLSFWITEKYFFDKLYFQKSVVYGYWMAGKDFNLASFGNRAKDIQNLLAFSRNYSPATNQPSAVLGAQDDGIYTIAIIGDSYVWGQGIRDEECFSSILEKNLNRIRPTKVISLALGGDNIFDNYVKYKLITAERNDIDLFIFGLVSNDLFLNQYRYSYKEGNQAKKWQPGSYNDNIYAGILRKINSACQKKLLYDPYEMISKTDTAALNNINYDEYVQKLLDNSYDNFCALEQVTPLLPKNNAIYFSYAQNDSIELKYAATLKKYGLYTISALPLIQARYPNSKSTNMTVSQKEKHPSAFANQIFAEVLFNEITNNKKWGFVR